MYERIEWFRTRRIREADFLYAFHAQHFSRESGTPHYTAQPSADQTFSQSSSPVAAPEVTDPGVFAVPDIP